MKRLSLAIAVFSSCFFFACQKEPLSKPVDFSGTEYELLSPYDSSTGKPKNLLKDTVSPAMLSFVDNMLPEKEDLRTTHPELLNSNSTVDLRVTQRSDVFITFVASVTRSKNPIAFYTYPTNTPPTTPKEIKKITYCFPNAGASTPLTAGDKVKIGTFEAGTSVGLVLLKDGYVSATGTLDNGAVHFCYNDALNPEVDPKLKKHVVLVNYPAENKILIGFEQTDRTLKTCDHDFNDVVLYATIVKS